MGIRRATKGDIEVILPMVAAICEFHRGLDAARYDYLPDVVERYRRWLPGRVSDASGVVLVSEGEQKELTGFLVGEVEENIPIYRTDRFGFVHDVWVEPDRRSRGVGRALVEGAVKAFEAMGVRQIRLETAAGNESARRLFASCGFRVDAMTMMRG